MKRLFALLISLCITSPLFAAQELVINLNDKQFRSQGDTSVIRLKRAFKDQFPNFDWARYDVEKFDVIAKSRGGRGQMWVEIGDFQTPNQVIEGDRDGFDSSDIATFRQYAFEVPDDTNTDDSWRLKMTGNQRLRFVKVTLKDCWQGLCAGRNRSNNGDNVVRVIELNDREIKAGKDGETIRLRRMIKKRYSGLDLENMTLKSVEVLAKSRRGNGRVALRVGDVTTEPSNIGGTVEKYDSGDADTFYSLAFNRPAGADSDNVWQLVMNGRFKIRHIAVAMERTGAPRAAGGGNNAGNQNAKNKNKKQNAKKVAGRCSGKGCAKGHKILSRAKGQRQCYQSGDGRYIDKRENAMVAFRSDCRNGSCAEKKERCYESRTCVCADGEARCTSSNSCGSPKGCKFGYVTLKMHCPTETFNVN